jgi:uncharacterized protein (DUF2461 family)
MMRTTLTIEDDVSIRLERLKEERGDTFKAVVNDMLRRGLDAVGKEANDRTPYRTMPHAAGACRLPNLDNVSDALEFGEGVWYR